MNLLFMKDDYLVVDVVGFYFILSFMICRIIYLFIGLIFKVECGL